MRILHLLAGTGWGGAERMGCLLHQLATAHGHSSQLDAPARPEILHGLREEQAPALRDNSEANTLQWVRAARRRRLAFRPDIVHAHLATPGLAGAAWLIAGRTPLALSFHLLPSRARWPNDYLLRIPSQLLLECRLRSRTRCVFVAVGKSDRARLQERFERAEVALTENIALPVAASAVAPSLPFADGVLRLLSVGRLVEQKGFDRMLRALAAPALRAVAWQWLIVGEGPARADLQTAIAAAGLSERVKLLGQLPADSLYAQAELVLCPSRYEGAPLVPLEALRARVPVVLSHILPHLDLLPEQGCGVLPEREDEWPAQLAPLLQSAGARAALSDSQAANARAGTSETLWSACEHVYRRLLGAA